MSTLSLMIKAIESGKPFTNELRDEMQFHFMRYEDEATIKLAQIFHNICRPGNSGNFIPAPVYIQLAMACKNPETNRNLVAAIEELM